MSRPTCTVMECTKPQHGVGLCSTHCKARARKLKPLYESWVDMRRRCSDERRPRYPDYGGRGIRVCEQWQRSYSAFVKDMGPKPAPEYSLERIDNDGDYEPNNCKWASPVEQANNKRNNRLLTFRNQTKPLHRWAAELSIPATRLQRRIDLGWSDEQAITLPLHTKVRFS